MSERSFSQDRLPVVVAHRGASAELPENTLAAFGRAVELGAGAVEFDVRLTREGVPVVLHDPDVERTTDGAGLIRDLTLDQVRALRIASAHEVPTLSRTLELLSGRAAVDIEIKNIPGEPDFQPDGQAVVDAVLRVLDEVSFIGPVLITSFNPMALAHVREVAPRIPTGLLTDPRVDADAALAYAAGQGHAWVLPFVGAVHEADPGYAGRVHAAGLLAGTWIVDEPAEAAGLLEDGLDAVATNDPRAILAALADGSRA